MDRQGAEAGVRAIVKNFSFLSGAGLFCLLATPAAAADYVVVTDPDAAIPSETGEAGDTTVPRVAPLTPPSGWQFRASPYLWMSGMEGDLGVSDAVQPVGVDLSFTEILGALKFALMGNFEARNDRFVASADMLFLHMGTDDLEIREPDFVGGELRSKTFIATLTAGYRAVDQGRLFFDILAGARVTTMKTGLDLVGPLRSFSGSASETWFDPIVGVRFQAPLGDRWALRTYGDIGGFGIGSDLSWQLQALVEHDLSRSWSLYAGWRHLDIDFEKDGFVFDAALDGPIFGAVYRF